MGIPAQPPTVDPRSAPDAARAGARARPGRARRDGCLPRRRSDSVIGRALLVRAWAVLGLVSAARVMAGSLCARQHYSYA
jgi:hypothetical protein